MCAVIILDFDDFKAINDQWGHDIGDVVLQEMGKVLKDNVRATDIVCRFGGEEFLLVLFHLQDGDAEKRAESLRSHIAETVVQADGVAVTITASLGVTVKSHPDKQQFDTMVHVADKAMYQAKHAGKNRVVTVP